MNPVVCDCPEKYRGERCERTPLVYTRETETVIAPRGTIQSPNYPSPYPNALTKTWTWMLQPFERIIINPAHQGNDTSSSGRMSPDFEQCCDSMKLFSGGNLVTQLSDHRGFNREITLTGHDQPLEVEIVFSSDGAISGNGTQLQYSISCLGPNDEGEHFLNPKIIHLGNDTFLQMSTNWPDDTLYRKLIRNPFSSYIIHQNHSCCSDDGPIRYIL